ncbi:MAG: hypothetical protein HYX25_01665 [Candidatus Solibacter usitatus]|nr:hypothetical protein [Candidatus Solibacter usitatus]
MNRPEFLAALARTDANLSAAPEVEQALLEALRRSHRSIWIRRASGWGALAAAMALFWILGRPAAKPVRLETAVITPSQVVEIPAAPVPPLVVAERPLRHKPARAAVKREVVTDFIPVMVDPDPFERGRLVRVKLPRSALTAFGLPVNEERLEERIQADVLIGEDGLARAIRFVK